MDNKLLETDKEGAIQPTKFDQAKIRTDLYPVRAFVETCKVFHYGSIVYAPGNWKAGDGFAYSRLINSAQHHLDEFKIGIDRDHESGLNVLGHAQCCLAMLLESYLTGLGVDDRGIAQIITRDQRNLMHVDPTELMIMPKEAIDRALAKRAAVEEARAKKG